MISTERYIDKILNKVPITLNLLTVLINILVWSKVIDIPFDNDYTPFDRFSYGIYEITNTIFTLSLGLLCYRLKFCLYNWVSVASLLLLNVNNLIAIFIETNMISYHAFESGVVFGSIAILTVIMAIVEFYKKPKEE